MPDRREQLRRELAALELDALGMLLHEATEVLPPAELRRQAAELQRSIRAERRRRSGRERSRQEATARRGDARLNGLAPKSLHSGYQSWYTRALRVVEQLLPDRYEEFRGLYRLEKRREVSVMTYTVGDYLRGITVTRGFGEWAQEEFDHRIVGFSRFQEQVEILGSAGHRLDALLSDIAGVLEAEMVDDELAAARDLLSARHLRSAGVVAGVVLERHLKRVMEHHRIRSRRKLTLAVLNDALKEASAYDVPQWRQIQRLGDLRNLAAHDGDRNPTADEIEELINGAAKIVGTVF